MTKQDYVGKTVRALCNMRLPEGHRVAPGESFRVLQVHVDAGCDPCQWIAAGNVELVPGDVRLTPKGGRTVVAAVADAPAVDPLPVVAPDAAGTVAESDLGDGPKGAK